MNDLANRARGISSLRDFLELLESEGQAITWNDRVTAEPDLRNIAVAASRDANGAPAIIFDNIVGYPGKRTVVGVHGSWDNIALLLGRPKGTTIRELFFEIAGRWGDAEAQISYVPMNAEPKAGSIYTISFRSIASTNMMAVSFWARHRSRHAIPKIPIVLASRMSVSTGCNCKARTASA